MSKFRAFTHAVAAALISVVGTVAYYLSTHPTALRAINDFLASHKWGAIVSFLLSQLLLLYHNPANGDAK